MSRIDFKEIPAAHSGAERDEFEVFAGRFLNVLGLTIVEGPSRGPDGGRDLVAEEELLGRLTKSRKRWLVSCKHKAHSGTAVGEAEESNIRDRLEQHGCDGFLPFYSVLPSSALERRFSQLTPPVEIWHHGRIESELANNSRMDGVFRQFFPVSYAGWTHSRPIRIVADYVPLPCERCGRDLLQEPHKGIVAFVRDISIREHNLFVGVYAACKGDCDQYVENRYRAANRNYATLWEDISDWRIPTIFMKKIMATFNRLRDGRDIYTEGAFAQEKDIVIAISQLSFREMSEPERERVRQLVELDAFML